MSDLTKYLHKVSFGFVGVMTPRDETLASLRIYTQSTVDDMILDGVSLGPTRLTEILINFDVGDARGFSPTFYFPRILLPREIKVQRVTASWCTTPPKCPQTLQLIKRGFPVITLAECQWASNNVPVAITDVWSQDNSWVAATGTWLETEGLWKSPYG